MDFKTPVVTSLVLIAVMFAASAVTFVMIFPSADIAFAEASPVRWMHLAFVPVVLFMMPSIALFLTVVMALVPRILIPQGNGMKDRWLLYEFIWIGVVFLIGFSHAVIIATSLGMKFT
ncbi:MAG: hypothetical protein HXY22_01720 [Alphaproteobacteria bacterium]|nr:hypothetical protein [Alphaproteobacteria bacterium]